MTIRILVAGIGNIFFRDDGFGPAVASALLAGNDLRPPADGVRVVDYGIRGMHLAYDLLDDVQVLILIDTVPATAPRPSSGNGVDPVVRAPGTITVLEVGPEDLGDAQFDAHAMAPVSVLAALGSLGGSMPRTYVVGCVPADLSEGIGLSAPVAAAIDDAVAMVVELAEHLSGALVGATVPPGCGPGG